MSMHDTTGNGIEAGLLRRMERSRQAYLCWIILAGLVEGGSLLAFVLLADWSDPLHQLLAVMSLLIYGTLGLSLMSLFFYVRYWMLRVIKAVEVLADDDEA